MAKFLIKQVFQNASVTQPTEYARICLDRVLNMPGFWIWKGSKYARITHRSKYATIWLNISEQDVNMYEFSIIDTVLEYVSWNTKCEVTLKVNECYTYWHIKYSELDERSKMERFGKIIIVLKYDKVLNICRNIIMEGFWIFQDSEKVRFLPMQELHKVLNMTKYGRNMPYGRVLKMSGHCFTGL